MTSSFIVVWDNVSKEGVPVTTFREFIDTIPEIINWRQVLGILIIASDEDETWIANKVHEKFPQLTFVVSRVQQYNVNGWADQQTWDHLNFPGPPKS